jgi:hypothetical protein
MKERKKAFEFYQEVADWNPEFRDVAAKLQALQSTN